MTRCFTNNFIFAFNSHERSKIIKHIENHQALKTSADASIVDQFFFGWTTTPNSIIPSPLSQQKWIRQYINKSILIQKLKSYFHWAGFYMFLLSLIINPIIGTWVRLWDVFSTSFSLISICRKFETIPTQPDGMDVSRKHLESGHQQKFMFCARNFMVIMNQVPVSFLKLDEPPPKPILWSNIRNLLDFTIP